MISINIDAEGLSRVEILRKLFPRVTPQDIEAREEMAAEAERFSSRLKEIDRLLSELEK